MNQLYSEIFLPESLEVFDVIIDVRSPSEFVQDHLPQAINLPALSNKERALIGSMYKKDSFTAMRKGAAMIARNTAVYLEHQLSELPYSANILIYCWRGNKRSHAIAHILSAVGWKVSLLKGGYQDYRKKVIQAIEVFFSHSEIKLYVIAGYSGVGKTRLLQYLKQEQAQVIDLENIAQHRGSLFGSNLEQIQPSQKSFENKLYQTIQGLDPLKPIFIEAESNRIGDVFCPASLWKAMKHATVISITLSLHDRVQIIYEDYQHLLGKNELLHTLLNKLVRLRGSQQVEQWKEMLDNKEWHRFIAALLEKHYDLSYQKSGSINSKFQAASYSFSLASAHEKHFQQLAQTLLQQC